MANQTKKYIIQQKLADGMLTLYPKTSADQVEETQTLKVLTADERTKLTNIEAGADVNIIEGITVNDQNVTINNKTAEIEILNSELFTPADYTNAASISGKTIYSTLYTKTDNDTVTVKGSKRNTDGTVTALDVKVDEADSATYATSAGGATNVTTNINGQAISSIFESNGTTVKAATNAGTATNYSATGGIATALGDKINTSAIANNLTTTTTGKVLDASQGKVLLDTINTKIAGAFVYKGSVDDYADLEDITNQKAGDVYNVVNESVVDGKTYPAGTNFAWETKTEGGAWDPLGGSFNLTEATSTELGGIKIGYTENGKNYPVELSSGKAFVNVPWTDDNTTYSAGDGLDLTGTVFSLNSASTTEIGGIKTGYVESGKNYPVEVDASSNAYVNVPWTDTDTDTKNTVGNYTSTGTVKLVGVASVGSGLGSYAVSSALTGVTATNTTLTATTFNGALNGNATSATTAATATSAGKLTTARTISLSGDVTGSTTFDGSENKTITATLANSGVTAGTYSAVAVNAKGIVTGGQQMIVVDTTGSINDLAIGGLFFEEVSQEATMAKKIYQKTNAGLVEIPVQAEESNKLTTARSIALTGDATSSAVLFDGSANITLSTTIPANTITILEEGD